MVRRLVAVPAALLMLVFTATLALGVTVTLGGTPIAWNDSEVEVECEAERTVASGMVEWHFIVKASTNDFTLDASFADGTVVDNLAPERIVDQYLHHFYVTTTLTTLNSASTTGSGSVTAFNLSHVCPNPGTEIPEAPASALLIASAAILGGGFLLLKRRQGTSIA